MARGYLLNDKYPIPAFVVWLVMSWAICLAAFTVMAIGVWMIWGEPDHNLLDSFPRFVTVLFGIWGVYGGIGAMLLWLAMWIYWISVERSSSAVRTVWFLTLLLGTSFGAMIYAFYLWQTGAIKAAAELPNVHSAGT